MLTSTNTVQPVGLHDDSRTQVLVTVPPVAWARRRAACTQNAVHHVVLYNRQLLTKLTRAIKTLRV